MGGEKFLFSAQNATCAVLYYPCITLWRSIYSFYWSSPFPWSFHPNNIHIVSLSPLTCCLPWQTRTSETILVVSDRFKHWAILPWFTQTGQGQNHPWVLYGQQNPKICQHRQSAARGRCQGGMGVASKALHLLKQQYNQQGDSGTVGKELKLRSIRLNTKHIEKFS